MAKQKQAPEQNGVVEAPVQLTLINFDDVESIETEPVASEPEKPPVVPTVDTEEQVLATVQTFESAFAGDPLAAKYLAFGMAVKQHVDTVDDAKRYAEFGAMCHNLMVDERNLAPSAYERPAVIKKCETALRLCGVAESMVRPNELIAVFWIVKLDRSSAGAEGQARTFAADETPAEWFGGNITIGAMRLLAKSISNTSKKNEIDLYEFKEGYEASSRDWIKRLRADQLSCRQLEALYKHRGVVLENERKAAKYQGLNADEIASIEASEKNATLQSKLNELGSKALELQKMAATELKKNGADLASFLANKGVIPPTSFPTPAEIAAHLTPGDAKALVQELLKLYPTRPDRLQVFKVLHVTCKAVVEQIKKSAQQQTAKAG
jgi:hypothetical protein